MGIIYRQATQLHGNQVVELCQKHGIRVPDTGVILVAIDEDSGNVKGVAALKLTYQVEPLISDDPMIALRLASMIEGAAVATNADKLLALVADKKEEEIKVFEKFGYKITDKNFSVLEKELK